MTHETRTLSAVVAMNGQYATVEEKPFGSFDLFQIVKLHGQPTLDAYKKLIFKHTQNVQIVRIQ